MLTSFNLKPGVEIEEFRDALSNYTAHLQSLDLVDSNGPIGRRQANTIMDTDERHHQYFVVMSFRDRAQCDRSIDYIIAHEEPGHSIHKAVYSLVTDQVFICWEDL
jgi:hypothetical protein